MLYAETCGINQSRMVSAIQKHYPHFGKVQMSLACNPKQNALQLIPAAEDILVANFGLAPGLSISAKRERKKRSEEVRRKNNQLCVRLSPELKERMNKCMERMGFITNQDFLEACVVSFLDKYEVY
mgnify:CR=1 FL=1